MKYPPISDFKHLIPDKKYTASNVNNIKYNRYDPLDIND